MFKNGPTSRPAGRLWVSFLPGAKSEDAKQQELSSNGDLQLPHLACGKDQNREVGQQSHDDASQSDVVQVQAFSGGAWVEHLPSRATGEEQEEEVDEIEGSDQEDAGPGSVCEEARGGEEPEVE